MSNHDSEDNPLDRPPEGFDDVWEDWGEEGWSYEEDRRYMRAMEETRHLVEGSIEEVLEKAWVTDVLIPEVERENPDMEFDQSPSEEQMKRFLPQLHSALGAQAALVPAEQREGVQDTVTKGLAKRCFGKKRQPTSS